MINLLSEKAKLLLEVARLPVAHLHFDTALAPEPIRATHALFTKPHPRYKLIKNKTIGVALIALRQYDSPDKYVASLGGRHPLAPLIRKARARGYVVGEIDRNAHVEEIHAINTSLGERQGRPMDAQYQVRRNHFEREPHFHYYGVKDASGKLVAYSNLGIYGNFAAFSQLIGYRNNDGVMHAMVIDIVSALIRTGSLDYLMYDTFFGAQQGMRRFKSMLGFQPYRAKYRLS